MKTKATTLQHKVDITEGSLSPISDMDFQFLIKWAAQGSTDKKNGTTFEGIFFMFSTAKRPH
jgi:hypothetical protein